MRWGWLICLSCLLLACSENPASELPTPQSTTIGVVREATPIVTEASPADENTTFLPAVETETDAAVIVAETEMEATPLPTPVPVSPRPDVTDVIVDNVGESVDMSGEADAQTTYTVQRGDILGFIARDFGISLDELLTANGITDPNRIEVGQVLVVPVASADDSIVATPTVESVEEATDVAEEENAPDGEVIVVTDEPEPTTPQTYVVKAGDSLGNIAKSFDISLSDLAAANGLSVTSFVYVNQVLTIPAADAPVEPAQTYTVQRGDTLRIIAERFGITINALSNANSITNPNTIYVGQLLVIPAR